MASEETEQERRERRIREFLDALERIESRLLTWGVVDGGFTPDELLQQEYEFREREGEAIPERELVDALLERRLLFEINLGGVSLYRTRTAEAVRLFARLRQLFPDRDWRTAPTLVADYRFALRPRVYPRRHLAPAEVIARVEEEAPLTVLQRGVLEAMLGAAGGDGMKLADFQLEATRRMLNDVRGHSSRGMIVTVGTGSGKTLAFYLPALTHIAERIQKKVYRTQALALYPRNELLKDQFTEAYRTVRRLDPVLEKAGKRPLRIGAYFGQTPKGSFESDLKTARWTKEGREYLCPFLRCPECDGVLAWHESDLQRGVERLQCTKRRCRGTVDGKEVPLTRKRMMEAPPDLVFTTTEMLNRQLGDSKSGALIGIGVPNPPEIVLLDEVHTYTGVHGAQVALLLRRWQRAIGDVPVQFTGLSATLLQASDFFVSLTGLPPDRVVEITPRPDEMVDEGMEYQLLLRGDPVSATSVLSTSIQTAMLLRRVLDPAGRGRSKGAVGERVFLFTDDLDVTNRLFHNLLDAEALNEGGRPIPKRQPLAALRSSAGSDSILRLQAGQSWKLAEQVGHSDLAEPLVIGRTSSQDTGVEQDTDVIVATAALEVGYNDPTVGAVMQHKAPRDMASFLQRRGRAGRDRRMRPWTVVVLSDYGRDRIAYQGYELLFDPVLENRSLPIRNRYVLRIQAVFALMDWMGGKARDADPQFPPGSVWRDFSTPNTGEAWDAPRLQRQQEEMKLLLQLLDEGDPALAIELREYLMKALQVSAEEAEALLWEPPRALMTAVLPTLLRRLERNWEGGAGKDYHVFDHPLPEFVPRSLFSDLNLPEVVVAIPANRRGETPSDQPMPIVQAIREFAPGRVTRRFGVDRADVSHWVAPPDLGTREQDLPVQRFCAEFEDLGSVQVFTADGVEELRCVRPWKLAPARVPRSVSSTSNAYLRWRTQLHPSDAGILVEVPRTPLWSQLVREMVFLTQVHNSAVRMRRFALGSDATLKRPRMESQDLTIRFTDEDTGLPAAVGFTQEVDGIVFRIAIPAEWTLSPDDPNQEKVRAFRTAYFQHRVLEDPGLGVHANSFQREWLAQIYLSALTATAAAKKLSLAAAHEKLLGVELERAMMRVLDVIFQSLAVEEDAGEEDAPPEGEGSTPPEDAVPTKGAQQKVHRELAGLFGRPEVREALAGLAPVLWAEPDAGWHVWARRRLVATLGAAFLDACYRLYPEVGAGDLYLDLDPGPRPAEAKPLPEGVEEIWITETTGGGGGVVEELLRRYTADPRSFFRLVEGALAPSDFELIDSELTRLLELTGDDAEVRESLRDVREAEGHHALVAAVQTLRRCLAERGLITTHAVMSGVNARILRPATSEETDAVLRDLIHAWRAAESELGIEIDARVFAYLVSRDESWAARLAHVDAEQRRDRTWRFQAFYGLLWPRGTTIRSRSLSPYNPFAGIPPTDRTLLLDLLRDEEPWIEIADPEWRPKLADALAGYGAARLVAAPGERDQLREALLDLAAAPVDIGFLHLYPRVHAVLREPDRVSARVHLREVVP